MPKEDILTKFKAKDYNNKLEEILEKKEFSNDVKNLLLNMLYKIEAGYNDYRTVKIDILEKKIIIEEIVRYVYENCSTIKLIEPKNDDSKKQKKYKIDKSKNAIMSYPNERDLLKAIYAISYNYIQFYGIENMIEESLSKFINIGYNNDIFEIIRDFNGWNWYTPISEIENYEYNIIYQNLKILTNNEFLYEIKNGEEINFNERVKTELEKNMKSSKVQEFMELIYRAIFLLNKNNTEERENIEQIKEENNLKLESLQDEIKYSEELFKEQKKYDLQINKIEQILNNPKLLNNEFIRRNEILDAEHKIFSISNLTEILVEDKRKVENKYQKISKKLNSLQYNEDLSEASEISDFINNLEMNSSTSIKSIIIELQKIFLKCFMEFITKAESKKQIAELIYTFRYYSLIYYDENTQIKDIEELEQDIKNIENLLIDKSIRIRMINELSANQSLNLQIISPIFELRNIELKDIEIKVEEDIVNNHIIQIEYLDNGIAEKTKTIDIENISQVKGLKFNKRIKIFN